jgi:hypothetical protein
VTPADGTFMIRVTDLLGVHEQELVFLITHGFTLDRSTEAYTPYETPATGRSLKVLTDGRRWQLQHQE